MSHSRMTQCKGISRISKLFIHRNANCRYSTWWRAKCACNVANITRATFHNNANKTTNNMAQYITLLVWDRFAFSTLGVSTNTYTCRHHIQTSVYCGKHTYYLLHSKQSFKWFWQTVFEILMFKNGIKKVRKCFLVNFGHYWSMG